MCTDAGCCPPGRRGGHPGKYPFAAGPAPRLAHGEAHGAGARPRPVEDDRRALTTPTRSPPRAGACPRWLAPRPPGSTVDGGHLDRHHLTLNALGRRAALPHLLQGEAAASGERIGWRIGPRAVPRAGLIDVICCRMHTPRRTRKASAGPMRLRPRARWGYGDGSCPPWYGSPNEKALAATCPRPRRLEPRRRLGRTSAAAVLGAPADLRCCSTRRCPYIARPVRPAVENQENTPFDRPAMQGRVAAHLVDGAVVLRSQPGTAT